MPCPSNFARNSLEATSNLEFASLQLQRLWTVSKSDRGKLRATFVWRWLWLWPCRGPRASEISRVKPPSPLQAGEVRQLKPPLPLRVGIGCFCCVFRSQWCCRFQRLLFRGAQWRCGFHAGLHQWLQRRHWFQSCHVAASCARKSSPCLAQAGHAPRPKRSARPRDMRGRAVRQRLIGVQALHATCGR